MMRKSRKCDGCNKQLHIKSSLFEQIEENKRKKEVEKTAKENENENKRMHYQQCEMKRKQIKYYLKNRKK